ACPSRGCQSRWSWWACVAQPQTTSSARVVRAPAIRSSSGSSQAGATSTARPASYTTVLVVLIVAEVNTSIPGAGSIRSAIASAFQVPAHVARTARSRTARAGKLGLVGKAGGREEPCGPAGPRNTARASKSGQRRERAADAERGQAAPGKGGFRERSGLLAGVRRGFRTPAQRVRLSLPNFFRTGGTSAQGCGSTSRSGQCRASDAAHGAGGLLRTRRRTAGGGPRRKDRRVREGPLSPPRNRGRGTLRPRGGQGAPEPRGLAGDAHLHDPLVRCRVRARRPRFRGARR